MKLIGFCILFIFLAFIIYYEYIVIDLPKSRKAFESFMYTILNALMFGIYLNITGFGIKITKRWIKYFLLFVILYLISAGFGTFGISITINLPPDYRWLLQYRTYCSNNKDGIWFITYNWYILLTVLVISFGTESEI